MNDEIREQLASYAHAAWGSYMAYFLNKCRRANGVYLVDPAYADALIRQINTPYDDLSEAEKNSDREEADKMLHIIGEMDGSNDPY